MPKPYKHGILQARPWSGGCSPRYVKAGSLSVTLSIMPDPVTRLKPKTQCQALSNTDKSEKMGGLRFGMDYAPVRFQLSHRR